MSSNLTAPTIFSIYELRLTIDDLKTQAEILNNLVVQLRSIVEPLRLAELFPKPQPLEVELGCGDASFLVEYARQHPERNFIGVERLLGRIAKLDRKGRRAGLTNLRGVRIESSYFLQYLLPPRSARGACTFISPTRGRRKSIAATGSSTGISPRSPARRSCRAVRFICGRMTRIISSR